MQHRTNKSTSKFRLTNAGNPPTATNLLRQPPTHPANGNQQRTRLFREKHGRVASKKERLRTAVVGMHVLQKSSNQQHFNWLVGVMCWKKDADIHNYPKRRQAHPKSDTDVRMIIIFNANFQDQSLHSSKAITLVGCFLHASLVLSTSSYNSKSNVWVDPPTPTFWVNSHFSRRR